MAVDVDLAERLYYFQTTTGQIWGRGAFRKHFWSRKMTDGKFVGFDTSREPPNRFGHLPLVRDRKTLRAMERPAGPAGTRAWHKRPLMAIMGKIDRETVMTRARLCVQRQAAVARLRKFSKPVMRHLMRYAEVWARDTKYANAHDTTRTWRDYYSACLDATLEGDLWAHI